VSNTVKPYPGICVLQPARLPGQGFVTDTMRLSVIFAAALAASADASVFQKRQRGNPDGTLIESTSY
jgi:hypothetical protein